GVTDINTGEREGSNERKTFAINCTPSLMGTLTSRSSVTSLAMRLDIGCLSPSRSTLLFPRCSTSGSHTSPTESMAHIGKKCHQNGVNPDIQRTKGDARTLRISNHRMREFASRGFFRSSMV